MRRLTVYDIACGLTDDPKLDHGGPKVTSGVSIDTVNQIKKNSKVKTIFYR